MEINTDTITELEQEFSTTTEQKSEETKEIKEPQGTFITETQQTLIKDISKVDIELEALEKETVNEDDFYDKLDDLLTDDEKYLQEDNPKAYLKLINQKKDAYIKEHSNESKKQELLEQKKDLELKYKIEDGIIEVTKVYKEYNHEEMFTFFKRKLSQDERDDILSKSNTMGEVFIKTYESYLEKNGKTKEIKTTPAPKTPNLKDVTKQPIKETQIKLIDSEDEKYKKALGV